MLAASVIGAWTRLRNALLKQFGSTYAWWFTLITVTQYHFMFYMSRPLPNIMVLPLGKLIDDKGLLKLVPNEFVYHVKLNKVKLIISCQSLVV